MAFLLILCVVVMVWLFYPIELESKVLIDIPPGMEVESIGQRLSEKGLLRTPLSLYIIHALYRKKLRAGEYEFRGWVSPFEVYETIASGKVKLYRVVIPEGSDLFDIAEILSKNSIVGREEFLEFAMKDTFPKSRGLELPTVEGLLFPDTYMFAKDTKPERIVEVMYENFLRKTKDLRDILRYKELSFEEWLTIASMIEKETALREEKPIIAAVIYNRLKKGMLLQIDPTVIYALKLRGLWRGKLYPSHMAIDNPYNTYRFHGLPPSPICNPGLDSLRAALAPAEVDYLYFVADGKGGHIFSRTYKEHLRNVRNLRR